MSLTKKICQEWAVNRNRHIQQLFLLSIMLMNVIKGYGDDWCILSKVILITEMNFELFSGHARLARCPWSLTWRPASSMPRSPTSFYSSEPILVWDSSISSSSLSRFEFWILTFNFKVFKQRIIMLSRWVWKVRHRRLKVVHQSYECLLLGIPKKVTK